MEPTTVGELGERELIARLKRYMAPPGNGDVLVSVGDDCAVLQAPGLLDVQILTTDLMIEGTHFLRNELTDWRSLGWKAVVSNLSDVATMGANPSGLLVSLGLPADLPVQAVEELYHGMMAATASWGGSLVGGDTTRSPIVVVNIAVTAWSPAGQMAPLRSSARPGHYVYVSGGLGGSLAGLRLLIDSRFAAVRYEPFADPLRQRHLLPIPRIELGQVLARACPSLAMIDISDGLFNELSLLAEASGVSIHVDLDLVPVMSEVPLFAEATGTSLDEYRLFSGEEYELLFTTALSPSELAPKLDLRRPVSVNCIGIVAEGQGVNIMRDGNPIAVQNRTFRHFSDPTAEP